MNNTNHTPKHLMTHVVIGYPSIAISEQIVDTLVRAGSTYIELQMPFSDPLADGSTIMHASTRALAAGITTTRYLAACKRITKKHANIHFISVVYANTLLSYGIAQYIEILRRSRMFGIIVPDLPYDTPEYTDLIAACTQHALHYIPVVAHNTPVERIQSYAATNPPFIYTTQYLGVTGGRPAHAHTKSSHSTTDNIARIRSITYVPIAIGFGVSTAADAVRIAHSADIVVMGSVFVRYITTHASNPNILLRKIHARAHACVTALTKHQ